MDKSTLSKYWKIALLRSTYWLAVIFVLVPASLNFVLLGINCLSPALENPPPVIFKILFAFLLIFLYCAWSVFFSIWRNPFSAWKKSLHTALYVCALFSLCLLIFTAFSGKHYSASLIYLLSYSLSGPVQFLLTSFVYLYFMKKLFATAKDAIVDNKNRPDLFHCILFGLCVLYTLLLVFVLLSISVSTLVLYGMETAAGILLPDRFSNWIFVMVISLPTLYLFKPFLMPESTLKVIPESGSIYFKKYDAFILSCLFLITLYLSGLNSQNRDAENSTYQQAFGGQQHYKIYQAVPLVFASKGWHADENLKTYFDAQRQILNKMIRHDTQTQNLRIAAGGDLLRMPLPQQHSVDKAVLDYLSSFDLVTTNLETLISLQYKVPPKSLFNMNSDPTIVTSFRDEHGKNLLTLLSVANNHIVDYPDAAIEDTLQLLQAEGIAFHGINSPKDYKHFTLLEINGIRIGYHATTSFVNKKKNLEHSNLQLSPLLSARLTPVDFYKHKSFEEIDLHPLKTVLQEMSEARVDLKIISLHWGREHMFYPDPVQLDIAHALVSAGADVIIGSHPHVIQPVEICFVNNYEDSLDKSLATTIKQQGCRLQSEDRQPRKALVLYSLGNLRSYSFSFWQQLAVIAEFSVEKDKEKSDWQIQGFSFHFDKQQRGLNSERYLMALDKYLLENEGTRNRYFSKQAERHLLGKSLSTYEENEMVFLTFIDSLLRFFDGVL